MEYLAATLYISVEEGIRNSDYFFFFFPLVVYMLQTRVYNNSVNRCGPMHVTIGDGGNREGLALL